MDKWIEIKKKQRIIRQVLVIAKAQQIVKRLMNNFTFENNLRAKVNIYMMIQSQIKMSFKRRIRKFHSIDLKHRNYIRDALTSTSSMVMPASIIEAQKPVLLALEKQKFFFDFREKLLITRDRVSFI